MLISVLALLPANDTLRYSAAKALGGTFALDVDNAAAPAALQLDPNFPAIPLGGATSDTMSLDAMTPEQSPGFIVRAWADIDLEDPPTNVDGITIFSDPVVEPFLTCPNNPAVGTAADVATLLDVPGLQAKGLYGDNVAIGIMDTGINLAHLASQLGWTPNLDASNSWTPPGGGTAGQYAVDHGTMCAYDALIAAPNATLLDFPIIGAITGGGSATSGLLSGALLAYSQALRSWASGAGLAGYNAVVLSNSWGVYHPNRDFPAGHPNRYIDNPSHPFNLLVAATVAAGIDVVFAAGNCGADCPARGCLGRTGQTIMGANAHSDVLTVAGCDTTNTRVGYSSQGPAITGMSSYKPDITGYTHFDGSRALGPGVPDNGTSAACPVVSGCVAAIRSGLARGVVSNAVFGALRGNATVPSNQLLGWNADYGYGIINPVAAATSLGL